MSKIKIYDNWQSRLLSEYIVLYERRDELIKFVCSNEYYQLNKMKQELLQEQLQCMHDYIDILQRRILLEMGVDINE